MSVTFHRGWRNARRATPFLLPFAAILSASPTYAASTTATGIDASFIALLGDLTGMLGGNFGALILLISLIIAAGIYAVTSNFRWVVASLMVSFLIGYGVDIIQGIGGVTASVDMIEGPLDEVLQGISPEDLALDAQSLGVASISLSNAG